MSSTSLRAAAAALLVASSLLAACGASTAPGAQVSRLGEHSSTTRPATGSTTTAPTTTASTTTSTVPPLSCSTASWPLDRQVAAMVFASLKTPDLAQVQQAAALGAGGIFLGTGAVSLLGTPGFDAAVNGAASTPFVAVDEEGGRVQRISSVVGEMPSPRNMHASMTPSQIETLVRGRAVAMRKVGVTMDFAPVVDVSSQPDDGAIGDRSFSSDSGAVAADAAAFARGLEAGGVRPVFKHFPGHGRAEGNSHDGLVTTPSISSLRSLDLVPYANDLPKVPDVAVMVGHLIVPGLTDGQPASVSRAAITGLLRGELGFEGLVITDDLGLMKGILDLYTTQQAAVRAAEAGADLLLVPEPDAQAVVGDLVGAVQRGEIPAAQVTASADRIVTASARAQGRSACGA